VKYCDKTGDLSHEDFQQKYAHGVASTCLKVAFLFDVSLFAIAMRLCLRFFPGR